MGATTMVGKAVDKGKDFFASATDKLMGVDAGATERQVSPVERHFKPLLRFAFGDSGGSKPDAAPAALSQYLAQLTTLEVALGRNEGSPRRADRGFRPRARANVERRRTPARWVRFGHAPGARAAADEPHPRQPRRRREHGQQFPRRQVEGRGLRDFGGRSSRRGIHSPTPPTKWRSPSSPTFSAPAPAYCGNSTKRICRIAWSVRAKTSSPRRRPIRASVASFCRASVPPAN